MKALVVGGGVAGPAVALALQQVGIDAVVLEGRSEQEMDAGSYLTLSPNGVHAVGELGLLDSLREIGFPTRRNDLVSGHRPAARIGDAGGAAARRHDRADPQAPGARRLLAEEAGRRGVEVRYDARVVAVHEGADGAEGQGLSVELADGSRVDGDLLVAADGVRSRIRPLVDPAAPEGRYVGLTNFGGITRQTALAEQLPLEAWQMVFGRHAFFGAHRTPDGDVVWFVNAPRAPIGPDERAATSTAQWQQWLVELLEPDAGPGAELVRTGELELVGDSTYDLGHVPRWHRGRIVLIGDAAHAPAPSSGQGASMALEDAVELARCLRDTDPPEAAFAAYEALRRERVERIVRAGARSSSSKTPGRFGRVVRDALMPLVFRYVVTDRSVAWMSDHRVHLDDRVECGGDRRTRPDYVPSVRGCRCRRVTRSLRSASLVVSSSARWLAAAASSGRPTSSSSSARVAWKRW